MVDSMYDKTQAHEFLRILDKTLPLGVSIIDKNMNYEFISQRVYDELGLTSEQLRAGDPLSKCHALMVENGLLTPEMIAKNNLTPDEQRQRVSTGEDMVPEIVRLGDGAAHRFIRKVLPDGRTVSISDNVTELVDLNDMLDEAMRMGKAGFWKFCAVTKKYDISKTLSDHFSAETTERFYKHGILTLIHADDRNAFKASLKTLTKQNNRAEITLRTIAHQGETRWVKFISTANRDVNGKLLSIRGLMQDITKERKVAKELERAKDEAIAASIAKSEFLANMSHEIRTPMNGVLGMAELLEQTDITDRQRDYIKVITNSSQALLTIINDILDFSKIEAGAFELDPLPFNLRDAVDDVMSLMSSKSLEKGLELIVNYSPSVPRHFIGDPGRIRQVLTNLMGNAIKFTEEGHVLLNVTAETGPDGIAAIRVEVKDTGIGIESEKLEAVFNKFTQADNSTTRVYGGTGLGLSISRRIVNLMDGQMWVESVFGEGSKFIFEMRLPVDTKAREVVRDIAPLKDKRVLIVDDIEINRQILMERCASWNMAPFSVADGVEALVEMKRACTDGQPYDFVILDYLMPGMNGQELAAVIRSNDTISGVPTIMLSSCDQPVSSAELNTIGISQYLVKPVREQRLLEAMCQGLASEEEPEKDDTDIPILNPNIGQSIEIAQTTPVEISSTLQEIDTVLQSVATPEPVQAIASADARQAVMPSSASTPAAQSAEIAPAEVSNNIKILVAEDFPLNQDVVRLMLQDTVYDPVFGNNGQEAVGLFKETPEAFQAILMDISMPVMDGYEAAETIHAYQKLTGQSPIPIIALTGHALKHDREKCLDASMCDYLTKPVKQNMLINTLNRWVLGTADQAKRA